MNRALPFVLLPLFAIACGGPAAPADTPKTAPSASAAASEPPDGPVPSLRTGSLAPTEVSTPIAGRVVRSSIDAGMETLLVAFDWPSNIENANDTFARLATVSTQGSAAYTFVDTTGHSYEGSMGKSPVAIWARRPQSAAGSPIAIDMFTPSMAEESGGVHLHLAADDPKTPASDPSLLHDWEGVLESVLGRSESSRSGAWNAFAHARVSELFEASKPPPPKVKTPPEKPTKPGAKGANAKPAQPARPAPARAPTPQPVRPSSTNELAGLMDTTTGALAVQEALQSDRPLFLAAAREKQTVALSTVKGPELAKHPWEKMTHKLGVTPPKEPLADAIPAEFYFVRAASFDAFTTLLDQADAWVTPAAQAVDRDPIDYGLAHRYEAELGVERTPLSRAFGSKVIAELAVTGSDPYFREGTDLTVIFRVKDHGLFGASLSAAVANHAHAHGAIANSQLTLAGVQVNVARSADGTVRQHRATIGDLEFVSNSPGALTRVLEAAQGKRARLSDESDFKFMLARDAKQSSDVLAYMGDKFVAEVVGPKQKIGEARRQLALGELMTPGFSALLYGYMFGKSPASADDLITAKILDKRELTHITGEAIAWKPGETARSSWGTPAELTPLIDLPAPDLVSESELQSYARFARGYQNDWGTYIDPVAFRLSAKTTGDHTELSMDLRELPLLSGSDYNKVEAEAGETRFDAAPLDSGARIVLALGERSFIRKILSESRGFFGDEKVGFDWIGDFVTLGVLDRSDVVKTLLVFGDKFHVPQVPGPRMHDKDAFEALSRLPLFAEIGVKNPLGATVVLTALRNMASQSAPGLVTWAESEKYRDVAIVKVAIDPKKAKDEFQADVDLNIYYALTHGALVVGLSPYTIHKLIDARLDDKAPNPIADKDDKSNKDRGAQLTLESASEKGRAVSTALAWLFEGELTRRQMGTSVAMATSLFRGAPDRASDAAAMRALAFAYFGSAPITADGGVYTMGPEGLRDPARGSWYAPTWPNVPIAGSPVEALMRAISRARADLSFDDEGMDDSGNKMRSLHARVTSVIR